MLRPTLIAALVPISGTAEALTGQTSVIDGDTLEIHDERVRILDAPGEPPSLP